MWDRQSFSEKSKWLSKRDRKQKKGLWKKVWIHLYDGYFMFHLQEKAAVFSWLTWKYWFGHLVLDFVTDFWPQKQGWICKSIIQILLYTDIGWKSIASFCSWLESISDAQGDLLWPAFGWKAGAGFTHSCWSKLHQGQVSRMILRRRLRSKPTRKIRQWKICKKWNLGFGKPGPGQRGPMKTAHPPETGVE